MDRFRRQFASKCRRYELSFKILCLGCAIALLVDACSHRNQARIAVIPQTDGTWFWESVYVGAESEAEKIGASIYCNAPPREDDVEKQVALVDQAVNRKYQGLVLAPSQTLALISPVRRAISHGMVTVVIGSPLPMPAEPNLSYVLNDDVAAGRMAAQRVASLIHGNGTVAVLGMNPDIAGIMLRARAFEQSLAQINPGIVVVDRRLGSYNVPHEQQVAEDALNEYPHLDVIVALMPTTVEGALTALGTGPGSRSTKVVGFDTQEPEPFAQSDKLDSIIQEDTLAMGQEAVRLIQSRLLGHSAPASVILQPRLITRDNSDSEMLRMTSRSHLNWRWTWIQ